MGYFENSLLDRADFAKRVGIKLRTIRLENKKSIEVAAFEAGMDYTQLSRIELGKINTSFFQIYKISKSLNVQLVDIVNDLPWHVWGNAKGFLSKYRPYFYLACFFKPNSRILVLFLGLIQSIWDSQSIKK